MAAGVSGLERSSGECTITLTASHHQQAALRGATTTTFTASSQLGVDCVQTPGSASHSAMDQPVLGDHHQAGERGQPRPLPCLEGSPTEPCPPTGMDSRVDDGQLPRLPLEPWGDLVPPTGARPWRHGGRDGYQSSSHGVGCSRRSLPTPTPLGLSHDDGDVVHGQTHARKFVIPVGEPLHGNTRSGHEQLEPRDGDGTLFASRMAMVKRVLGDSLPQAPVKAKLTPKVRSSYQGAMVVQDEVLGLPLAGVVRQAI